MRFFAHGALCYVLLKLLQDFFIFRAKKLQIVKKTRVLQCSPLGKNDGSKGVAVQPPGTERVKEMRQNDVINDDVIEK